MQAQSFANTGPRCRIMETSELFAPEMLSDQTCSAADSPAKTSQTQESAQVSTAKGPGCGASTPELLASYDPITCSWRTSQLCLDGALSEFSETWPRSGLMRSGIAYQLPPLVRLTDETDCGLLPTPDTGMSPNGHGRRGGAMDNGRQSGQSLDAMARHNMWPTPCVPNGGRSPKGGMSRTGITPDGKKRQVDLRHAVTMWPTPTSRDWRSESCSQEYVETRNAETRGKTLAWTVNTPRTTPRSAMEYDGVTPLGNGGLNPTWVEWLMGFPLAWTVLDAWVTLSSRKSRK
jgi:hypothetical protein